MSHDHSPAGGGPTADVSVRVAWADDAPAIAAVQVRAWPALYADLLPAGLLPTDVDAVADQWRQALARPADARNRVLVALERNRVVGFAQTTAAADPHSDPVAKHSRVKAAPTGAAACAPISASGCRHTSATAPATATNRYTDRAIHAAGTWMNMIRTLSPCW